MMCKIKKKMDPHESVGEFYRKYPKPIGPRIAFVLYIHEIYHGNPPPNSTQELLNKWRNLSTDEKERYVKLSKEDFLRYIREIKEYYVNLRLLNET